MTDIPKVGDRVLCKIKGASLVSSYSSDYDEKIELDVIATNYQGYYLYIPPWICIKDTTPITQQNYKSLGIHPKFIDSEALFITGGYVIKVSQTLEGMFCQSCNEYFQWAEVNQSDGSFICWNCRTYRNYY